MAKNTIIINIETTDLSITILLLLMTSIAPSFHFQSMEELPLLLQKLCLRHSLCFPMIRHRPMLLYRHCCMSMGLKYKGISNVFGVGKLHYWRGYVSNRIKISRTYLRYLHCTHQLCLHPFFQRITFDQLFERCISSPQLQGDLP